MHTWISINCFNDSSQTKITHDIVPSFDSAAAFSSSSLYATFPLSPVTVTESGIIIDSSADKPESLGFAIYDIMIATLEMWYRQIIYEKMGYALM